MHGTSRRLTHPLRAAIGRNRAAGQQAPELQVLHRPRYRYWAFISYSSIDERWARSLHRKLEAYRIPRDVRPASDAGVPSTQRLRPVFRDDDELAASADLGARLHDALDRSRYLIVVASPAAASSEWVNAEVQHFVDANRAEEILVLVVDGEPGGTPELEALPAALRRPAGEPLWVDGRGRATPDRRTFLRLVAGMLDTGFDALWRRDRRRRRRQVTIWTMVMLLLAATVGGIILQQQRIAEEDKPQRQVAAFRQFLVADILNTSRQSDPNFKASDVKIEIVRAEDLNGDSLIDFFVYNETITFCGSGGCGMDVYISEGRGKYRRVLDLFASTTPRTRAAESGVYKEIVATEYAVENLPVYTVFRWTGEQYELSHYEFCDSPWFEGCKPFAVLIRPLDQATGEQLTIAPDAAYVRKPETSAPPITWSGTGGAVIGEVAGGDWYLVDLWKGLAGFVSRRYVHHN